MGVRFNDAILVFDDPFAMSEQARIEGGEHRWRTIGLAGGVALPVVAHTAGDLDEADMTIRVISARRADKRERKDYEQAIRNAHYR